MGTNKFQMTGWLPKIRQGISTRVHSRRLQLRLQVGSSSALIWGLVVTVLFSLKVLAWWNDGFFDLLVGTPSPAMIPQDEIAQIVIIFIFALLGGATLPHFRFLSATALMLLYDVLYLSYTLDHFRRDSIVAPIYPLLALLLTHLSVMLYRYFAEDRPRASIGRIFRRYVSVDTMDQVMKEYDKEVLTLDSVRRMVTVLHVDLRDLSTAADLLDPQTAVNLVNKFFSAIVPSIFQYGGTIVKQSGNGIVAVWNMPIEREGYADAAVQATIQIKHTAAPLQVLRTTQDIIQARIRLGYGIASGLALGGHVGVPSHSEYTIIGEVITVAERLAMKPDRGVFIEAHTRDQLTGAYELKEVNPVRLRRQTDPVSVWEVTEPMQVEENPAEHADVAN
jgi:class 3 adenylate cyclase